MELFNGVMQGSLNTTWIDVAIIVAYLVGIVGLGCLAGMRRREHEGDAYFLGGKNLTWPVIGGGPVRRQHLDRPHGKPGRVRL